VTLARPDDTSRSLQDRFRSYLDANCSQCHRPGGTVATFDARYQTPLDRQNLIDGSVLIDQGLDHPHIISPHDPWRSMIIRRTNTIDDTRMPPLARHTIDQKGVAMLKQFVLSLPGRDVLAPPTLLPAGGEFKKSTAVTLASPDAGAQIHYTTDGSEPGEGDPVYKQPIRLAGPTVVRARAIKDGMKSSIIVQDTYIVDP
jgi:mono/diheme cytochrome c family protein